MTRRTPPDLAGARRDANRSASPSRGARSLLLGLLLASALWLVAPRAEAACSPDTPPLADGGSVTCDGTDETGFDASGATNVTITTSGTTVIDDSGAEAAGIVVGDGNTVTLGADSTLDVVDTDGVGLLGGNDNDITLDGTINVDVANGAGVRMGSNTDPTGGTPTIEIRNTGDINLGQAGGVGIDVTDNYDVTNAVGGTITVTGDDGVAIRGVDDNILTNSGTIVIDGDDGRAIQLNENTGLPLPNGAISDGTITINGARGVGIEVGDDTGTLIGDTNLNGVDGVGLRAGDKTNPSAQANHTNTGTINVAGDRSIGLEFGDGWQNGTGVSTAGDISNRGTINVSGNDATGLFAGDDSFGSNANGATIDVTGTDSVGISLGGNSVLDPSDEALDFVVSFTNGGTLQGDADAGPLVVFRVATPGFENRLQNSPGAVIAADVTNLGTANRGIAIQGTAGGESIINGGDITGDVLLGAGDDTYLHADDAQILGGGTVRGGSDTDTLWLFSFDATTSTFDFLQVEDFEAIRIDGAPVASAGWDIQNASGFDGDLSIDADGQIDGAFTFGSGANVLTNAGVVNTSISLAGGDDVYHVIAGGSIDPSMGSVSGGADNDTIRLDFDATLIGTLDATNLTAFESVEILGDPLGMTDAAGWRIENAAGFAVPIQVLAGGRLVADAPTTLGGDLDLTSSSTVRVDIDRTTPTLVVSGSAALAGELEVVEAAATPTGGTFRVVRVDGGLGGSSFDTVTLPSPMGLFTYSALQDAMGVVVTVTEGTFAAVGRNANNVAIGVYLDAIRGGSSMDLETQLDDIASSTGNVDNILTALSPEPYDAHSQIVLEAGRRVAGLLLDRPRDCTPGELDPWLGTRTPLGCHERRWAPWVAGIGSFRDREAFAGRPEYDAMTGGVVVGIDAPSIADVDFTLALSAQESRLDLGDAGRADISIAEISAHASWSPGPLRIQSVLTWAHGRHDASRRIAWSEGSSTQFLIAEDNFNSQRLMIAAEAGILLQAGPIGVEPLVGLDWARIETDAIDEAGASPLGSRVASRDDDVFTTTTGVRLSTVYEYRIYLHRWLEWATGVWRPTVDLRWRQTWSGYDRSLSAAFTEAPSAVAPFSIEAREDRGGFEAGLALTFEPKYANRVHFDLRYDAYRASHTLEHDLVAKVRVGF